MLLLAYKGFADGTYVLPICFWGQLQPAAQAGVRVEKTSVFGRQLRQFRDLTKDVAVFK